LKGTLTEGITYRNIGLRSMLLHGLSDSDWASEPDNRRSVTGYCFFLAGAVVSSSSKRQTSTALSSAEAEYMALSAAVQEAIFLRALLKFMGFEQLAATEIAVDNQACIAMSQNQTMHRRAKHIDIRHHYIREKVKSGEIVLAYIPTGDNVADIFTKALPRDSFRKHAHTLLGKQACLHMT
jgi:hypothetical protein